MNGLKERSSLMVDGIVGSLLLRLSYTYSKSFTHSYAYSLLATDGW